MRYPAATWRGTEKHGYPNTDTHLQNGVVIHSMEGSLQAGFGVLDGPRQASWHFSVSKTGEVYQHVDTGNIAWTNGGFDANRLFWGIECEGVEGEPLTEPQFEALLDVVRWLWDVHQVGAAVRQETLWEHNEMTQFGSAPTSCPSNRIPWERLISELEGDMAFTAEQEAEIRRMARNEVIDAFEFAAGYHGAAEPFTSQPHTLRWWIAELDKRKNEAIQHGNDAAKHAGDAFEHDHEVLPGMTTKAYRPD